MKKAAPFLVLLAGILWGSMGLFVRTLNRAGLETMNIVFLRAVVTAVILFAGLLLFDKSRLKIKGKDLWCFLGTGLCSVLFFNFCYFGAILETSLSVAAVLLYTAPIIVMVLSGFLFGEAFTVRKLIAVVMTFAGCILVTGITGAVEVLSLKGLLLGLGAGFGYALYSIFSRYALERGYSSVTISFYTFLFAGIGAIPLSDTGKVLHVMGSSWKMGCFCILFGVVSTVIPYFTYTRGLRDMENGKASILASVEPVVAALLGIAVFHESMSLSQAAGVLLVLGAILLPASKPEKKI